MKQMFVSARADSLHHLVVKRTQSAFGRIADIALEAPAHLHEHIAAHGRARRPVGKDERRFAIPPIPEASSAESAYRRPYSGENSSRAAAGHRAAELRRSAP